MVSVFSFWSFLSFFVFVFTKYFGVNQCSGRNAHGWVRRKFFFAQLRLFRQPISYLCSRWSRGHNSFRSSEIVVNWIFLLWDNLWNRPQNVIELILILAIIVSIIIVNRLQSSWYLKGELGNCFKNQILLNFSSCQTLYCRPWTNLCQLLEGWLLLIWPWRVILKFKLFWFSRHYENLHNFIIRRKNEEKLTPWSICRKCLTFLIEPLPPR